MDMKYARIIRAVRTMAWAIVPERLIDIMDVLSYQAAGGKLSPEDAQAYAGMQAAALGARSVDAGGGLQVLSLRGIIAHRIEAVEDISGPGGTSVERFSQRFNEALHNDNVSQIVIDVDSPGGSVDGVPELADEIRAARGTKPILAIANTFAASAAYWIGSAADEFSVTPSGEVGSIGVFTAHADLSAKLEAAGEQITLIHAGKFKIEGNPFEPLADSAREHIQRRVDAIYEQFVDAIARARDVPSSRVRGGFGQGRTVSAHDALAEGMVDHVETFDQLMSRLRGGSSEPGRMRGSAPQGLAPEAFQFLKASDFETVAE